METYGIYLAYPPGLDLRAEGLGRHLAEFLKEAKDCSEAKFVIACPSWMRKSLQHFFEAVGISPAAFEIIGPQDQPTLLKLYQFYRVYKRRTRCQSLIFRLLRLVKGQFKQYLARIEVLLVTTRNDLLLISLALLALPFALLAFPAVAFASSCSAVWTRLSGRLRRTHLFRQYSEGIIGTTLKPQANSTITRLYSFMQDAEAQLLLEHINCRKDISAWYSPTSFWPQFHQIEAPRLTCVPDVLLSESPVGFSSVGGDRFLQTYELIEATIEGGDHFVTYSDHVKYRTLVDRYQISPDFDRGGVAWGQSTGWADCGLWDSLTTKRRQERFASVSFRAHCARQ